MNDSGKLGSEHSVMELVAEIRAGVRELGGQIEDEDRDTRERYLVNGEEFARAWVYKRNMFLILRVPFDQLDNPSLIGEARTKEDLQGWPAGHFGSYFEGPEDWRTLKPLLEQAYRAVERETGQ